MPDFCRRHSGHNWGVIGGPPVAKGRLPAAFGLLNLHTNRPGCIRVGDLIPLRNPETSPSTNLLGLFFATARGDEARRSAANIAKLSELLGR